MAEETLSFQSDVARLLDIVVHSLYSEREIFLRELISNASDACDKLRYRAITEPELIAGDPDLRIELSVDGAARTLTVADNGIGMNRDELVENLGTIARSGTGQFLSQLSGDARKDVEMIGRFGVGFYSAFMVADRVEVITRKAGEEHGWRWESDGKGTFVIDERPGAARGARVILHLKEDATEFLEEHRLRHVVKTHSDHVGLPVILKKPAEPEKTEAAEDETPAEAPADETLNTASALWTRSKSEISEDEYKEFYHHVAHAWDDPWMTLHYRAEGALEYTGLLFVPSEKPFDLFRPERKPQVKLYVNRVFVTDDGEGLLPGWLRFVRGVVDSPDLPLAVSREMLQNEPRLAKIRSGLTKRLLDEIGKRADAEGEEAAGRYAAFWETFGPVLKEGLYEDFERRGRIAEIARFHTTADVDGWVSLAGYVERMKEGQAAIYFVTGGDVHALARSPQVEGFRAKGVEVLLLSDPIDEFWTAMLPDFQGKPFKSVAQGAADLSAIGGGDEAATDDAAAAESTPADAMDALVAALKVSLGERVKDVRASGRLTESACCLVAEEGGMSTHLERLLRQHNQGPETAAPRILEINPKHGLIRALATRAKAAAGPGEMEDAAFLLLDQARIVDGDPPTDPIAFAGRLSRVMERGMAV